MEQPNFSYVDSFSKGDGQFKLQLLGILKEEVTEDIDGYHEAMKVEDYTKAKLFVHRIKHKMSMLGLEESYKFTNTYESDLRSGDLKNKHKFEEVLPVMKEFLKDY